MPRRQLLLATLSVILCTAPPLILHLDFDEGEEERRRLLLLLLSCVSLFTPAAFPLLLDLADFDENGGRDKVTHILGLLFPNWDGDHYDARDVWATLAL